MNEIWKDIEEYEDLYQVSNLGRVKSLYTNKILKGCNQTSGYLGVNLSKNSVAYTKSVHRLVAQAFIPNSENKSDVNHIDENKSNNNVNNLQWSTRTENINYGTRNKRVSKSNSIPIITINLKTNESTEFYGINECARQLSLDSGNICKALKGRLKQTGGYTFKYKEEEH